MEKYVLTVTLNPAVDKTLRCGELAPGRVNRMKTVTRYAGGKGINVSRILRQYDVPVVATGFLGGAQGKWISEQISAIGIQDAFVYVAEETRCSTNVIAENGYVTEILEPGPSISKEELKAFMEQFQNLLEGAAAVVLSGSAAPGVPDVIYAQLIKKAKDAGVCVFLDSSGEYLKKGITAGPDVIKPNKKELEYAVGQALPGTEDVAEAAHILRLNGIGKVLVSMGSQGLFCAGTEGYYLAKTPQLTSVNTVGCGDAVVASAVISYLEGKDEKSALITAAAVSAAASTTEESGSVPLELAEEIKERIKVFQLIEE